MFFEPLGARFGGLGALFTAWCAFRSAMETQTQLSRLGSNNPPMLGLLSESFKEDSAIQCILPMKGN